MKQYIVKASKELNVAEMGVLKVKRSVDLAYLTTYEKDCLVKQSAETIVEFLRSEISWKVYDEVKRILANRG